MYQIFKKTNRKTYPTKLPTFVWIPISEKFWVRILISEIFWRVLPASLTYAITSQSSAAGQLLTLPNDGKKLVLEKLFLINIFCTQKSIFGTFICPIHGNFWSKHLTPPRILLDLLRKLAIYLFRAALHDLINIKQEKRRGSWKKNSRSLANPKNYPNGHIPHIHIKMHEFLFYPYIRLDYTIQIANKYQNVFIQKREYSCCAP